MPATPPAPTGLMARYYGDPGGSTQRYYWVQALFPDGRSPLAGPVLVTTPAGLSSNNRVLISWQSPASALSFDVLETPTSSPPTGTGLFAVAVGITQTAWTDTTVGNYMSYSLSFAAGGIQTAYARITFADDAPTAAASPQIPKVSDLIPQGAIVVGGQVKVGLAVVGPTTVSIGTSAGSSGTSILAATAVASLSLNAILNTVPTFAAGLRITAAGQITFTTVGAAWTAGQIEVWVFYINPAIP